MSTTTTTTTTVGICFDYEDYENPYPLEKIDDILIDDETDYDHDDNKCVVVKCDAENLKSYTMCVHDFEGIYPYVE